MNQGAFVGALIASIGIFVVGLFLLSQQLVWRKGHMKGMRLLFGIICLGGPLYIFIGYRNTLLYLTPVAAVVCLVMVYRKGTHRYVNGHPDREKTRDATTFLVYCSIPIVIGGSMFLLDLLRLLPAFNRSGLSIPVGIVLILLLLLAYCILIYFLSRQWARE